MAYTKDDVATHRSMNGLAVPLSDEERQAIADRWNQDAAGELAKRRAVEVEAKRGAALAALQDKVLASALLDPNAPQAVKDYAVELAKGTL